MIRIDSVYTGLTGMPGVSSLYFAGASQEQADSAAAAVLGWWTGLQAYIADEVTVDVSNLAVNIDPADGEASAFYSVAGATITGTNTSGNVPRASQGNLRFRTQGVVGGRRVVGRMFVDGLCEDINVNGRVIPLVAQNLGGLAATELGSLGSGFEHVVWSRPVDGGRAGSVHPVTVYDFSDEWAVLRSRRD